MGSCWGASCFELRANLWKDEKPAPLRFDFIWLSGKIFPNLTTVQREVRGQMNAYFGVGLIAILGLSGCGESEADRRVSLNNHLACETILAMAVGHLGDSMSAEDRASLQALSRDHRREARELATRMGMSTLDFQTASTNMTLEYFGIQADGLEAIRMEAEALGCMR